MRQDSRSDETDSIHPTELKISETLGPRDSRFTEFTRWIGVPGRHPGIASRRGDVNVTEVGHHVTACHFCAQATAKYSPTTTTTDVVNIQKVLAPGDAIGIQASNQVWVDHVDLSSVSISI